MNILKTFKLLSTKNISPELVKELTKEEIKAIQRANEAIRALEAERGKTYGQ